MGLHSTGFIVPLLVLLPNLLFIFFQPRNAPESVPPTPLIFTSLERAGQISCFMMPILFGRELAGQSLGLSAAGMAVCLLVYYGCWVRYYRSGRKFSALFSPWLGIPVPMALFPAIYFLLLGFWLQSWLFIIPALLFAIGHLVNSWSIYNRIR
ncbi:hypothetical protein [Paenibacillus sp. MMS20-IR301]|uniref:hypothetical protein n=1 Tax=Paenibacillus sp. MMS20-IR301 TaxID=2895946 RepID=UPI0028EE4BB9|nr:hypothetical protein [Paenibacillus sp. MMS20-IR301]WNS43634.1 hypothetical protein LOS79_32725 [Paenibacillus sp. MMS20-IR301]